MSLSNCAQCGGPVRTDVCLRCGHKITKTRIPYEDSKEEIEELKARVAHLESKLDQSIEQIKNVEVQRFTNGIDTRQPHISSSPNALESSPRAPSKTLKKSNNVELSVNKIIDLVFALLYVYLIYALFTSSSFSGMEPVSVMFGLAIGFGCIYFLQKIAKAILGTIARSYDSNFSKT